MTRKYGAMDLISTEFVYIELKVKIIPLLEWRRRTAVGFSQILLGCERIVNVEYLYTKN